MIERLRAAVKAFRNPEPEQPVAVEEALPPEAPCPKCSRSGEELMVQHVTPSSKTHYCRACRKFYRPA